MGTSEQVTFELLSLTVDTDEYSTIYLNTEGQIHRLFGPAVIWCDGDMVWCWRGMRHRVGGKSFACGYWLFSRRHTKETYDFECTEKTNPLWKEYDAELQQYT